MLGEAIKHYRSINNLTQQELARLVPCSVDSIRRWETNLREPRATEIIRLCEIFGCSESDLLKNNCEKNWELKLVISKGKKLSKGVIDLTGNTSSATLEMADDAMGITLSAGYDIWSNEAKFEDLIQQLRRKRNAGLKTRAEEW
ncbi:MAG: helix-turn-helix transcriptional regulator [Synergistaceae bacterium]|nr:helix-turn-helix transcriptional regulator [Synergistaceae bacterium]MBR0317256.1 helix-turn-helix transcriptional regulator [Synergistaceae bacterium]